MMSKNKQLKYNWTEDIWAIHIEVRNDTDEKGTLVLDYAGSDYEEKYPIGPSSSMRYNVCRHSAENTHLLITVPEGCEVLLFENLDRAFYTTSPTKLEVVED